MIPWNFPEIFRKAMSLILFITSWATNYFFHVFPVKMDIDHNSTCKMYQSILGFISWMLNKCLVNVLSQ